MEVFEFNTTSSPDRVREWAVDGSDGSAKSPILARVKARLEASGLRVLIRAPFALANALRVRRMAELLGVEVRDLNPQQRLKADIYFCWAEVLDAAPLAIDLLASVIASSRQEALAAEADVLLWDRHWPTVMVEVGAWEHLMARWGGDLPETFLIWAPPSQTRASSRYSDKIPWTSSDETILSINARYESLWLGPTRAHIAARFEVTHREQDLRPIVDAIVAHIEGAL